MRLHLKKDARSIEGYLSAVTRDHYELVNARILISTSRESDQAIDGEAWWPRADVLYIQVIG